MSITARGFHINFIPATELLDMKPPDYLVDEFIKEGEAVCLWGPPNQGKSFLALDWALCIATGKPWLDSYAVKEGPVVYMAGEGGPSLQRRVKAWCQYHGIADIPGAHFQLRPLPLREEEVIEAISETINTFAITERGEGDDGKMQPRLIVVDTLSQFFGGGDENTNDMAVFVGNLRRLSQDQETAILIVHHGTKGGQTIRGHSSLEGNLDVIYHCIGQFENEKITAITIDNPKQRDSAKNERLTLKLHPVGDEETGSLVVVPTLERIQRSLPTVTGKRLATLSAMLQTENPKQERCHHRELADVLGIEVATVHDRLDGLVRLGLVKKGRPFSSLTTMGRLVLEKAGVTREESEEEE